MTQIDPVQTGTLIMHVVYVGKNYTQSDQLL